MASAAETSGVLQSRFLKLEFDGPSVSALCVDPSGRGRFGKPVLTGVTFGARLDMKPIAAERGRSFEGVAYVTATDGRSSGNNPFLLDPGHTLSVIFTSPIEEMTAAGLRVPTWNHKDAAATLKLYRAERTEGGYSMHEEIAGQRFADHPDNAWMELSFPPQPSGTYVLLLSDPHKEIGVWGDTASPRTGDSFADGRPIHANLNYRFSGRRPVHGRLSYTVDDRAMTVTFKPRQAGSAFPAASFETPWEKDGYNLRPSPFDACYTDAGQWIFFNQIKRRPHSGAMLPCNRLTLRAFRRYDLAFEFSRGARFEWSAAEKGKLRWLGGAPGMTLSVRRPAKELPQWAPVFETSDGRTGRLTTEFYLSHGANFGVGTYPDWKEWQGQILSWTASPLNAAVARQLTRDIQLTPEGYVHTWGSDVGWPFPVADSDGDGANDYDTRHFTTNSCFILGAWRLLSWNRDEQFARDVLGRARLAMDYQLTHLQGERGVLITNAGGHTGKHGGIGSNYWDILPFGHKDAFSNIYFVASLEAMANIERFAAAHGTQVEGKARSPEEYDRLAVRAKSAFRRTFWLDREGRFAGCVDEGGAVHDYGFSFINLEAAARGIPSAGQARRMFDWLESAVTSSGKCDMYSRWQFAARSLAYHNPRASEAQAPRPSWWFFGWPGSDYDAQCQDGGAILYVAFYDLMARLRYLGPDSAMRRYQDILKRYDMPDRLSGGSPLWLGEQTQGGPGGGPGSVGVEGEFPESGIVPCFLLHGVMGLEPTASGLLVRPGLPGSLQWVRCRNVCYAGDLYTFEVNRDRVLVRRQKDGKMLQKALVRGRAELDLLREEWR